ncbi:MAG: hypothetical protein KF777_01645 [Planctomycetaceae bacterium]|nr:hypothetical protein [Planctomycetaceae bacterium]
MVRDVVEIQRAHDVLQALLNREIEIGQSAGDSLRAQLSLNVLCWVLGHASGDKFGASLASIENRAVAMGYRVIDTQATEGRADAAAH